MTTDFLSIYQARFSRVYPDFLPRNPTHVGNVYDAVAYSFAAGGKRLRPALMYALGESLNMALERLDAAAVAIECIHTYSLIHDDLPDMDDDDLRRGKPACHKQFSPATAILAGDALNTLAFEILAQNPHLSATARLRQIEQLAHGAGIDGMVGGQDTDLTCENANAAIDIDTLSTLHQKKTAKLIEAALLIAYSAQEDDKDVNSTARSDTVAALSRTGLSLGLLYQIQDDILDVTQSTEMLGKPAASDIAQAKSTYVSLLGLAGARQAAADLVAQIETDLNTFFAPIAYADTPLAAIISAIISREH